MQLIFDGPQTDVLILQMLKYFKIGNMTFTNLSWICLSSFRYFRTTVKSMLNSLAVSSSWWMQLQSNF